MGRKYATSVVHLLSFFAIECQKMTSTRLDMDPAYTSLLPSSSQYYIANLPVYIIWYVSCCVFNIAIHVLEPWSMLIPGNVGWWEHTWMDWPWMGTSLGGHTGPLKTVKLLSLLLITFFRDAFTKFLNYVFFYYRINNWV